MPRPLKPEALRQRRNRATTHATLPAEAPPKTKSRKVPPLPSGRRSWHVRVSEWWTSVWLSPMATQYAEADIHALYVLAELLERFWRKPSAAMAKEIRLSAQPWGLNPLDRRRLQWKAEEPKKPERPAPPARSTAPADDPRKVLQMPAPRAAGK